MKPSININQISIPKILGDLAKQYQINFLNYSQYHDDIVDVYRSGDPKSYNAFLEDQACQLPLISSNQTQVVPWSSYCSQAFLEECFKKYKQYPNGACIILRHLEFAEHISIGTANPKINLYDILSNDIELKSKFIERIRNSINFHPDDFTPFSHHHHAIESALQKELTTSHHHISEANEDLLIIGKLGPTIINATQKKCLIGIIELKTAKQIANEFHLAIKTIQSNSAKLKQKLGAKTRHDLYEIAQKNKLI